MTTKIKRWLLDKLDRINGRYTVLLHNLREKYDLCEFCHQYQADYVCVGCNSRMCGDCDSHYYYDAELCKKCRSQITPEEEEQDRREALEYAAEEE